MGKLIDADKLKEAIRRHRILSDFALGLTEIIINDQPAAYNAEKVLEALKKESINAMFPNGFREPCVTLKTAETIVKAGGIDEIN